MNSMEPSALGVKSIIVGERSAARIAVTEPLVLVLILVAAAVVSLVGLDQSGTLWPDDARYLNGAAMIHDWLLSGQWTNPLDFAMRHYAKYPGFSIPYHPPAYPGLLGVWFLVTGISYESARVFISCCLMLGAFATYRIVRHIGGGWVPALMASLFFILLPELAKWSRSTMSDIPALTFILWGTWFFLKWCQTPKVWLCVAAFAFAELAFLSRVTSIGVVPMWFLYLLTTKGWRSFKSWSLVVMTAMFLLINVAWVQFVAGYASHELNTTGEDHKAVDWGTWDHLSFYLTAMPELIGRVTAAVAVVALVIGGYARSSRPLIIFGGLWFLSYFGFQLFILANEARYFVFALPGVCAILVAPLLAFSKNRSATVAWLCVMVLAMAFNVGELRDLPRGVVGYQAVADRLASETEQGNLLLCTRVDQDFIFHYHAAASEVQRSLLRADRTLSVRVSEYAKQDPTIVARDAEDVFRIIEHGRVRYLLTSSAPDSMKDDRHSEKVLAHHVASHHPDRFALLGAYPLLIDLGGAGRTYQVHLWRYKGELKAGESEIPVIIPTAKIVIPVK